MTGWKMLGRQKTHSNETINRAKTIHKRTGKKKGFVNSLAGTPSYFYHTLVFSSK
ncbi:hypothetical protein PNH38_00915 [Anoxybacillus rupiensis]|uniref:Uncharacterized protein n=1 Tax=Anoxybacteroides rupiense TaxID=311460 RepID=A0ABT5VZF1_9BACL|nr:hypothetical protein [Anoxybacillus rupiensis]